MREMYLRLQNLPRLGGELSRSGHQFELSTRARSVFAGGSIDAGNGSVLQVDGRRRIIRQQPRSRSRNKAFDDFPNQLRISNRIKFSAPTMSDLPQREHN